MEPLVCDPTKKRRQAPFKAPHCARSRQGQALWRPVLITLQHSPPLLYVHWSNEGVLSTLLCCMHMYVFTAHTSSVTTQCACSSYRLLKQTFQRDEKKNQIEIRVFSFVLSGHCNPLGVPEGGSMT